MCGCHWQALRDGIEARGITHLVNKTGEAAVQSIVDQLEGERSSVTFDPLMNANFGIFSAFIRDGGIGAASYEGCPICVIAQQSPEIAQDWIDGSLDEQLAAARALGLVARPS